MSSSASVQTVFSPSTSPTEEVSSPRLKAPLTDSPSLELSQEPEYDFATDETQECGHMRSAAWSPQRNYTEVDIGCLAPGPQNVVLTARIVNFHDRATSAKGPQAAKGCIKIIVKDDTAALTIRLWYAQAEYQLRLGQLVSIWTAHLSTGNDGTLSASSAPLFISMFPERDRSCNFMIRENSDSGVLCKTPLDFKPNHGLSNLYTLRAYIDDAYELLNSRILVVVKSLGPRKKITTKKGNVKETRSIIVFDNTADAVIGIWDTLALASTESWIPSQTLLLVTNARCDVSRRPYITLTANTFIDVDPAFESAEWLRSFALNATRQHDVSPQYPENVFDLEQWLASDMKALFTLSEIDKFVRSATQEVFIGFLSVVVLELNISLLHTRNMLFSAECCGVPIYSNTLLSICKQCASPKILRLNPKVIGLVLDETGSIASGKLIFSTQAWTDLFGRSPEKTADASTDVLKYLEQRISGLRVSLIFGWAGSKANELGGRLCVLGVRS